MNDLGRRTLRGLSVSLLLGAVACSGSINCGGCTGASPIPGGFDPEARIPRAMQVRLTRTGLDFLGTEAPALLSAYGPLSCGTPDDVPCPVGFVDATGAPNPSSCDDASGVCVEQISGQAGPLLGFEIERSVQGDATICRDDPALPGARRCYAWLRLEGVTLDPLAPDRLRATVQAQVDATDIPIRYNLLGGIDCILRLSSVPNARDIEVTVAFETWTAPGGGPAGQLSAAVVSVVPSIPEADLEIVPDPNPLCSLANTPDGRQVVLQELTTALGGVIQDQLDATLGRACGPSGACPTGSTCDVDADLCRDDVSQAVVPVTIGQDARVDLSALLGGFFGDAPLRGDFGLLLSGDVRSDAAGVDLGLTGGLEPVDDHPLCGNALEPPRLRPGFVAPVPLPAENLVDLDDDGTPETPYMMALGVSQALLSQAAWSTDVTGLLCQTLSGYDVDLLNTGALGLLVPSISRLTHRDRLLDAVFPVRLTLHPRREPVMRIGAGRVSGTPDSPTLDEPLVTLELSDLAIGFYAPIEERWVRLMTITADLALDLGAMVDPAGAVAFVLGDPSGAVTNVRVTNSELLAEDPAELAGAIPALIALALPSLTDALGAFPLPGPAELGGFELDVLGVRGVEVDAGVFSALAVYADLGFNPSLASLSGAAETGAEAGLSWLAPEAYAVSAPGGPRVPELTLSLFGRAPGGQPLEHQFRIDGGLWSPFFSARSITVRRPELAAQGRHTIEVRARVPGAYRTLDPTPVRLEVVVDAAPPELHARFVPGGLEVRAFDAVSHDRVAIALGIDGVFSPVIPDDAGFVASAEVSRRGRAVVVSATDEAGNTRERILREGPAPPEAPRANGPGGPGCRCVRPNPEARWWLLSLIWLVAVRRRRG